MRKKKVSKLKLVLLVFLLLIGISGCASESPANVDEPAEGDYTGRTLTLQVWPGSYEEVLTEYVYKPFTEKYGIEIVSTTAVEWYSMAKIKTEVDSGDPQVDVVTLIPGDVITGERMNVWEELDPSKITAYEDLYDGAKISPNSIGYLVYRYGFGYRLGDDVVEPPKTWTDLADARFAGKLTLTDSHPTYIIQSINYELTGSMTNVDLDAVFEVLEEIKPNILNFNKGAGEIQDMINRAEVDVAPMFDGRIFTMRDAGTPVEWYEFESGTFAAYDYFAILKGSKNADIAHLFIDFILQPEQQLNIARYLYYAPTNSTVELPADLAEIMPYGKDEIDALLLEDIEYVSANEEAWWERWSTWMAE